MTRIAPLLLVLVACGASDPTPPSATVASDVEIDNQYAESLFTLRFQTDADGGTADGGFVDHRVGSNSTSTVPKAIPSARGASLKIFVGSTSLGQQYTFPVIEHIADGKILTLTYDYDLATANFTLSNKWGP
jgi:hypothetical protein